MGLLSVKNLTINFDDDSVIKDLSFEIEKGDFVSVIGPNGSGKSSLLKALLNLIPFKGEIVWQPKVKIGYLPQGLTPLKVKDYPLTVFDFFKLKNKNLSKEEIIKILKEVDLGQNVLQKKIGNLSGGQFQKMLIKWVLMNNPDILILDEPETSLDYQSGETIYSLLKELWEKKQQTILLVTHEFDVVGKYSNKVLCLAHSNYHCLGKANDVLTEATFKKLFGKDIKLYQHTKEH